MRPSRLQSIHIAPENAPEEEFEDSDVEGSLPLGALQAAEAAARVPAEPKEQAAVSLQDVSLSGEREWRSPLTTLGEHRVAETLRDLERRGSHEATLVAHTEDGVRTVWNVDANAFSDRDLRDVRALKFAGPERDVAIPPRERQRQWFLARLFPPQERLVVQARFPDETPRAPQIRHGNASWILKHSELMERANAEGAGILVSAQPRRDDFFEPRRTGHKADVKHVRNIILELDGKEGLTPFESLEKLAQNGFPKPTVVLSSSPGKYHVWYSLKHPLSVPEGEKLIARMVEFTDADPAAKDATRFLRLPNFRNTKPENKGFLCEVVLAGERVDPEELVRLLPPEKPKAVAPAQAEPLLTARKFSLEGEKFQSLTDKLNPNLGLWLRERMQNPRQLYYPGVSREIIGFLGGEFMEHNFHKSLVKSTFFLRHVGVKKEDAVSLLEGLYPEKLQAHKRCIDATWQKNL